MVQGHKVEVRLECLGLAVQLAKIRVLDPILAGHLPDEKLAVAVDRQSFRSKLPGTLESAQQRAIFGEVVGRSALATVLFNRILTVTVNHIGKRRRSRVAPRSAIDV